MNPVPESQWQTQDVVVLKQAVIEAWMHRSSLFPPDISSNNSTKHYLLIPISERFSLSPDMRSVDPNM